VGTAGRPGAHADPEEMTMEHEEREAPEDRQDEPGAEGGTSSSAKDTPPPVPDEDDDSPLGDSDQHSDTAA
jgi:hypothetical protein